jgi:hypothetical protein
MNKSPEENNNMTSLNFTKDDVYKVWEKVSQSIVRCDSKISISLAFAGIFLGAFFTNERIYTLIKGSIIYIYSNTPAFNLLYSLNCSILAFSAAYTISIIGAIIYLLNGLRSTFDKRPSSEYSRTHDTDVLESKLYWTDISNKSFNEFYKDTLAFSENGLYKELILELYICSVLCRQKYKRYNRGLDLIKFSVCFFILLKVLSYFI